MKLYEVEVDDVMKSIAALAARESLCDVTDVVKVQVVQDDELPVSRRDDILLEIVGAETVCQCFADERVLGQVTARAAVGDDDGAFSQA